MELNLLWSIFLQTILSSRWEKQNSAGINSPTQGHKTKRSQDWVQTRKIFYLQNM